MKHRSFLPIVAVALMMVSTGSALAAKGPCTTAAASDVGNAAIAAMTQDQTSEKTAINNFVVSPVSGNNSGNTGPFACVSSIWPGISSGFHLPTMDQIINGILTAQIQKACNAARTEVSQATSGLSSQVGLNTGIPGMPSIGGNLGSTTGAANAVSVNGSSTVSGIGSTVSGAVSSANSATTSAISTISSPVNSAVSSATSSATSSASSGWSTIKGLF